MESAGRFYLIVSTATVIVMYGVFKYIVPYLVNTFQMSSLIIFIASIFSSVILYRLIAWCVRITLGKWLWLRSKVFGPSFLHGTWIGYFRGHSNELRYVVEHFEQDFDGLVIRGKSFDEAGKEHANWVSMSASVDPISGVLTYLSGCDIMSRNVTVQSVCVFHFERDDKSDGANGLVGYAVDVNDGVRIAVTEKKLDPRLVPFIEALPKARNMVS